MVGSLWTGISGLTGSQTALDNESNNIANVNTIGYKSSRISFTDQMYQAKIGKGVTSFDVEKMYSQGNLKLTGVSYDMALSGDGFFVASNGKETFYSRAGNFRMGESGTLEDVGKNHIQGWAMQPLQEDNIVSTDPNATRFTDSFTKVIGNKIIRDSGSIETIIAKATDYTATAVSDSQTVFSGAGYKSASTKIADVEQLITEYNVLLTTHSNADPKPTSSSSSNQQGYMNFALDSIENMLDIGDEMYIFIDGTKYSQTFDTDETTTLKKFADVLSNTAGLRAYYTDGVENNPEGTVKEILDFSNVYYEPGPEAWFTQIGKTIFVHPMSYSKVNAKTSVMAWEYFMDRQDIDSVVSGHTHQQSMVIKRGRLLIEQGCLCLPLDYAKQGKLTYEPSTLGYTVIYQDEKGNTDFNMSRNVFLGIQYPIKKTFEQLIQSRGDY